jgi:hypothetical protein
VPKPIPDSIHEQCQDQDQRHCQHAQPFLCVGARLVHTSEFLPGEMGAGTTSFHSTPRPRSPSGRSRQEPKGNKSQRPSPSKTPCI